MIEASQVEDIPTLILEDGAYILDLEDVDFSEVDPSDPVEVLVDVDFGSIEVRLPEDVDVQVEADANVAGAVRLFDDQVDGFSPGDLFEDDDPQLILGLEVDFGDIEVVR